MTRASPHTVHPPQFNSPGEQHDKPVTAEHLSIVVSCLQEGAHIREVLSEEVLQDTGVHLVPWPASNKVFRDVVVKELYQAPEGIL